MDIGKLVKRSKWYLYLLPLFVCIIFLELFIFVEQKINITAFEKLSAEKAQWFETIVDIAPIFQYEDEFFQKLLEGDLTDLDLNEKVFVPYDSIISGILNSEFTFNKLNVDSITLIGDYPVLSSLKTITNQTISYNDSILGYTRLYVYHVPNQTSGDLNNYWLFGITESNIMKKENLEMQRLVIALLSVTFLLNIILIFLIKRTVVIKISDLEAVKKITVTEIIQ
jgi:hypothetical protein